jgi:quercetin dioxygenase-like cupin family protein
VKSLIVKNFRKVKEENVEIEGGQGIKVRWLVDDNTGINFAMRRYELRGVIPVHKHSHEHEIYVLEGEGEVIDGKGEPQTFNQGDFAFIPPDEPHGFKSKDKAEKVVFLCMVPRKRGETEKLH